MRAHLLLVALAIAAGCDGRSADPGVSADLQVAGAEFVPGPLPAADTGPAVVGLQFSDGRIIAGAHDRPLLGQLDPTATAVALELDGDRGYWIVPAGVPATEAPTLPTIHVQLAFAARLPSGTRTLLAQAADAGGRFGAPTTLALDVAGVTPPAGALVVHLAWSGRADLDLHVIDPTGVEIWSRHPSGYQPPPPPQLPDPTAAADAAQLDLDSNAHCAIDGRDQENVVYMQPPPRGHYVVRVDAFSLCGDVLGDWRVEAIRDGASIGAAAGEAVDADTRAAHDAGAGRTALEFDVP
jgi:hypothetical protein